MLNLQELIGLYLEYGYSLQEAQCRAMTDYSNYNVELQAI